MIDLIICVLISFIFVFLLLNHFLWIRGTNKRTQQIIKSKIRGHTHPLVKHLDLNLSFQNSSKNSMSPLEKRVFGSAFIGMSLLDVYTVTNKHIEILQVLKKRMPNEMGKAGSIDWLNKVAQLKKNNSSQSYVSFYTGEKAEIESKNRLRDLGYRNVEQFPDKNHPHNDLKGIDSDGNEVEFSVKSYGNAENFKTEVMNSNSENYIVNSELYQDLEKSGKLADYKNKNIEIIDGKFSHNEHISEARTAFEDIEQSMDVLDDISLIALANLTYKTYGNIVSFKKGNQSKKELRINFVMDTFNVGVRGVSATAGAKIAYAFGNTYNFSGIGNLVMGIKLAILTGEFASQIVKDMKEKWKWGDIIKAIDYYGEKYYLFFNPSKRNYFYKRKRVKLLVTQVCEKIYNSSQILKKLKNEEMIYKKNSRFLSRWFLVPRSIQETLILEHMRSLKKYSNNTKLIVTISIKNLQKIFKIIDKKLPKDQKKIIMKRLIGEFVVENKDVFINKSSIEETKIIRNYHLQKEKCPNHPYKISKNSSDFLKEVLRKNLEKISA